MFKPLMLSSALAVTATIGYVGSLRVQANTGQANSRRQTQAVVDAATAFLGTLGPDQRGNAQFAFAPQKSGTIAKFHRTPDGGVAPGAPAAGQQGGAGAGRLASSPGAPNAGTPPMRDGAQPKPPGPGGFGGGMGPPGGFIGEQYGAAVWSNYPVSDVLRPGLRLGTLTSVQRAAATHLLQTVLSPMGFQKVLDIMGSDQALADAGTNFVSGEAAYTIGIFGQPSVEKPWMIEFGGHHLGLNIVIAGPDGVMTPTLTGAQPSVYKRQGNTVRVLARENDTAFALLDALDPGQRAKAILNYEVRDLVLGPGTAGMPIQPEGIKASELNGKQKALLLDVISQWAAIVNDSYAKPRMAQIQAGLEDTYFAWSGPTTHDPSKNGTSYYRIQGPRLVIEFSPQGVGGDPAMHVHTIYRDPTDDYGVKLTGAQ